MIQDTAIIKWYSNGQLCSYRFYDHGILEGDYKRWHSDGKLHYHKVYLNGEDNNDISMFRVL